MRHQKKGKKLSRKRPHRNHLMRNLITQVLLHSRIETTLSKAKAVKPQLEKTISKALDKDEMNAKRFLDSHLYSKKATDNLLNLYRDDLKKKDGGYTKLIKLGKRKGDGSQMVLIDLRVSEDNRPEKEVSKSDNKKAESKEKEEEKGSFWDRFKSGDDKPDGKSKKSGKKAQTQTKKEPTQRTTSK